MLKMVTGRLDRGYNSPTHAPGFQIDYPPPPSLMRSGNGPTRPLPVSVPTVPVELPKSPPPLPPKTNVNPLAVKTCYENPRECRKGKVVKDGPNPVVSGSGFVLNKVGGRAGALECSESGQLVGGTWSGGLAPLDFKASSLLDSHDRFKPDKNQRRLVQRMKWSQSRWGRSVAGDLFSYSMGGISMDPSHSMSTSKAGGNRNPSYYNHVNLPPLPVESESRVSSMTIADVSPRLALKKVLLLYEHAQYRDAASFINRLGVGTFRIILRELPMDVFVEAMPHSLPILESLYSKIFNAEGPGVDLQLLKPEAVVMHMVKFFSREDIQSQSSRGMQKDPGGTFTAGCRKILSVVVMSEPQLLKKLRERARNLDKVVEGMGQHGLVGTTDESLLPLHDALKLEFQRVVETYKGALQKLEELALANKSNTKSVAKGPAPVNASHQRQLSLKSDEIQERLIKNKSVLNAVEATLDNHCLDILLGILQRRIEVDKEALFQFTQLRKETGDVVQESQVQVAPLLMKYSRGCKQVLELMREVGKEVGAFLEDAEDDSSDLSGYHSDSDSAIMTSGNSPFITPRARYNFLTRSVRSKQAMRPSLLNSTWNRSRSKSVGASSTDSSEHHHLINPAHAATPLRPRHVKIKNQLHKHNSLGKVSTSSTGSESSTSGCGTSLTASEGDGSPQLTPTPSNSTNPEECIECITVVSVPDNQVITQGVNHHCSKGHHSPASSTSTTDGDFIQDLKMEISQLKRQLQNANATICRLQEKSCADPKHPSGLLRKASSEQAETKAETNQKESKRAQLVRDYGGLYAQARVDTMDALDALPELNEADELKSKLLFSVVVLAFRSVQSKLAEIKEQVSTLLQFDTNRNSNNGGPQNLQPGQEKLVEALSDYLSDSQQKFDQNRCVDQVANQLWTTLYDYPCLRKCDGLLKYIRTCVNLAWGLSNQTPPCVLEYESKKFTREMHVRFHSSDASSETVLTYIWPALVNREDGRCVHKGVVIT